MATSSVDFVVHFDAQERDILLRLLEQAREDSHAERRRTEKADYRELLSAQQALVEKLIAKLQQAVHEPLESL